MRDSQDPKVQFLWQRMLVSTRPDPSDAGMAWFLVTGDEEASPEKLKQLLDMKSAAKPVFARGSVRIEAENFQVLENCKLEDRNDRTASHRLNVVRSGDSPSGIRTRFIQPYAAAHAKCDVEIRYMVEPMQECAFQLRLNGSATGEKVEIRGQSKDWASHVIRNVAVKTGDEVAVDIRGFGRLDYVQLNQR